MSWIQFERNKIPSFAPFHFSTFFLYFCVGYRYYKSERDARSTKTVKKYDMSDTTIIEAVKAFLKPIITEAIQEANNEAKSEVAAASVSPAPHASQELDDHGEPLMSQYYTVDEIKTILHIGTTSVYNLFKRKKLTKLKILGKTVVARSELDHAVETEEVFRYKHGR